MNYVSKDGVSDKMTQEEKTEEAATVLTAPAVTLEEDTIVQWVILRKDLRATLNWPLGSVIAQGCHASSMALQLFKVTLVPPNVTLTQRNFCFCFLQEDEHTMQYVAPDNLPNMHKVVLEVKGQTQLENLSAKLTQAGLLHALWLEQPENIPTCIATKPYPRSIAGKTLKKLQLCK